MFWNGLQILKDFEFRNKAHFLKVQKLKFDKEDVAKSTCEIAEKVIVNSSFFKFELIKLVLYE